MGWFAAAVGLVLRGNNRPAVAVFTCKAQRQPFDIAAGVAFLLAPNVSMYRQAAEVIDSGKPYVDISFFLDKSQHLAAKRP